MHAPLLILLSVIIPIYNVESYLDKCIESVVRQTYKDLEILLINDGSTDDSGKICEKWAERDERIIYIDKKNEGSGKTRNLGIEKATGEYITFLDSDDWWETNYAELMMAYVNEKTVVVCDMNYIDSVNGEERIHISQIRFPDRVAQLIDEDRDCINRARTFLCGKIFPKKLFVDNKIKQPSMAINDIPITTLLVAKATYVCRVGVPLYNYLRTRPGNTITSIKALKSFGEALVEMKSNFEKHGLLDEYKDALKKMYYSQYRFAMKKALVQKDEKNISESEFFELQKYLRNIVSDFWKDFFYIDEKTFYQADDEDVYQAIKLVLIDEKNIVSSIDKCDYVVVLKDDEVDLSNASQTLIRLYKNDALKGETLWWDLADQILFQI